MSTQTGIIVEIKNKIVQKRINYYKIKIYDKINQTKEQTDNLKIEQTNTKTKIIVGVLLKLILCTKLSILYII